MSTDNAYFISGHGDQDAGTFIVPEGCYVVAKKEICKLANSYTFHDDFERLLEMDMNDILHPLYSNSLNPKIREANTKLRKALGESPNIYAPGDVCPNFRYYLCNVHVYDDRILVDNYVGSGIIDLRAVKECRNMYGKPILNHFNVIEPGKDYNRTKEKLIQQVVNLYHYCVYPQKEDIRNYLTERWKDNETVPLYDMIEDLSNTKTPYFKDAIRVTQEQLCKASKGVFYHNVCRALSSKLHHHGNQLKLLKNGNNSNKNIHLYVIYFLIQCIEDS